jgi:hypothetical protein
MWTQPINCTVLYSIVERDQKTHGNIIKSKRWINTDSTSHPRNDLSALRRGRLGGGSRGVAWLACVFVSFKCLRYGFDMPIEVEQRVVHLAVPRVTIYRGNLQSLKVNVTYRTTPCESMKNVIRPGARPIKLRGTLYALRPSPD